jgi:excisionase family DNA binding protein
MDQIVMHTITAQEFRALIGTEIREALKELPNQSQAETETLLTRSEAAQKLKVSLVTLNDWTKRGLIQSYTIGGRVLYKAGELENSLHKNKTVKY